jgi:hypothetical protein
MKNFILTFFILNIFAANAQTVGDIFISKSASIPITYVKDFDTQANNLVNAEFLVPYIRYEITSVKADDIEFQVLTLRADQPSAIPLNYKIYKISKTDYARVKNAKGREILSFGALALPVKLRSSEGEINFETDFNVNFTLAVRLRESFINDWDLTWQIGFGLGSTNLTSTNSSIEAGKDQSVETITGLTGINLRFQTFQIGLYTGVDYINNQSEYDWKYNGNMFISAGIGINIFGGQSKKEKKEE